MILDAIFSSVDRRRCFAAICNPTWNPRPTSSAAGNSPSSGVIAIPPASSSTPAFSNSSIGARGACSSAALGVKAHEWPSIYGVVGIPLVDSGARFISPARFGDVVELTSQVTAFRRSSFDVEHRLTVRGATAVEGRETRVWAGRDPADPDKMKSKPIPPEVTARFQRLCIELRRAVFARPCSYTPLLLASRRFWRKIRPNKNIRRMRRWRSFLLVRALPPKCAA